MGKKIKILSFCFWLIAIGVVVFFLLRKDAKNKEYSVNKNALPTISTIVSSDYLNGELYLLGLDENSENCISKTNLLSRKVEKIPVEEPKSKIEGNDKDIFDGQIDVGINGLNILYRHINIDNNNAYIDFSLYKYDLNGKVVAKYENIDIPRENEIVKMSCSDDKMYVISINPEGQTGVHVFSTSGARICEYEDIDISAQYAKKTATMGMVYLEKGHIKNINDQEIRDLRIKADYLIVSDDSEYEFLYYYNKGLYGYTVNGEKTVLWDSDIKEIMNFDVYSLKGLYGLSWETPESVFINQLQFGEKLEIENTDDSREEMIIATVADCIPYTVLNDFNSHNSEYRITVKHFESERDLLTYYGEGNQIDLFDLYSVSEKSLLSQNTLEDLSGYFEKDADIKKSEFDDSFYSLYENDKLYYISGGYRIETVIQNFTEKENWNWTSVYEYAQNHKEDYNFDEIASIFYISNQDLILNKDSEESFFGKSDNIEIINEFKNFKEGQDIHETEENNDLKIILNSHGFLDVEMEMSDFVFIANYNRNNTEGNRIIVSGYPTNQGGVSYVFPKNAIAMNSKSKNKDAAWEFLKLIISYEYMLDDCYSDNSIPYRRDCMDTLNKVYTCKECFEDPILGEIEPAEYNKAFFLYEIDSFQNEVEVNDVCNVEKEINARKTIKIDYDVFDIYFEEISGLMTGKSIETICANIDNRINLYLSE